MIYPQFRQARLLELMTEPWGDLRIPGLLDLIRVVQPKRVLEIGSHRGVSTEVFLLNAQHVTAVDPWPDITVRLAFEVRAASYPHCRMIRGTSPEAVQQLSPGFDLVYIDGDHSYDAVIADIRASVQLRRPKWIGGHDYDGVDTPDVARAVEAEFACIPILFSDSSWLVKL